MRTAATRKAAAITMPARCGGEPIRRPASPTSSAPSTMRATATSPPRRTADLLEASVLPRPVLRSASAAGFTPLFDGTVGTFKKWQLAGGPNGGQGFTFIRGELVSYGSSDFALLYYAPQAFDDFHLRL